MVCQSLVQGWQGLYEEHADEGFMVINVVMEDAMGATATIEDADDWGDASGLTYPVLADVEGAWADVYVKSGENFATYLIDRDGIVVWREFGEELSTYDRAEPEILDRL